MATRAVLEHHRTAVRVGDVAIAPLHQPYQHRLQVQPFAGEVIFEARRARLVLTFFHEPMLNQSLQSGSQNVARDAEVLLDQVKPMRSEEDVAQHQDAPHIAQHVQGARDGAG